MRSDPGGPDDKESGSSSGASTTSSSGGASSGGASSSSSGGGGTPTVRVAFIGDTGTEEDFKSVLAVIRKQKADLLLVQGDLNYTLPSKATTWFSVVDDEINKAHAGSSASVTIPYLAAKGNHDIDWSPGYGAGFAERLGEWSLAPSDGKAADRNYAFVFKGLKIVFVDQEETSPQKRADYVTEQLDGDDHAWKICSWHKNQRRSNVGPKSDEMGWDIYERCRSFGAIVAQGHSHTYSRSKTLTNDAKQTVDATCDDPFALCVGPGRHFFFDSSLGGRDIRPIETDIADLPHWASTFGGNFGALFIDFNVGGDDKRAEGWFETITGEVIDPPASSGKTRFTITRTP